MQGQPKRAAGRQSRSRTPRCSACPIVHAALARWTRGLELAEGALAGLDSLRFEIADLEGPSHDSGCSTSRCSSTGDAHASLVRPAPRGSVPGLPGFRPNDHTIGTKERISISDPQATTAADGGTVAQTSPTEPIGSDTISRAAGPRRSATSGLK